MINKDPKILIDSSSPEERRGFLKKLGAFVAGTAALGGFTNLKAKNTFSGKELSVAASPEAYIGSITMFGGNFAIRQWALCHGQLQSIAQNTALFSILGTTFGGDGRTTFGLPDFRGRAPMSAGTGPGLPTYREGQKVGSTTTTLTILNLPSHNHSATITTHPGYNGTVSPGAKTGLGSKTADPTDAYPSTANDTIYSTADPNAAMGATGVSITHDPSQPGVVTIGNNGGSQSFNLMQPTLAVNFIICLIGVYPPRN